MPNKTECQVKICEKEKFLESIDKAQAIRYNGETAYLVCLIPQDRKVPPDGCL
jgi:hypothetical protein